MGRLLLWKALLGEYSQQERKVRITNGKEKTEVQKVLFSHYCRALRRLGRGLLGGGERRNLRQSFERA